MVRSYKWAGTAGTGGFCKKISEKLRFIIGVKGIFTVYNSVSLKLAMKKLLLITALSTFFAAGAQETPISVIEAESASLTPPVKVKRVNGYSGNAYVGDFDKGSVIRLNHVTAEKEGTYEFRVYYTSMFMRSVNVSVNNYPAVNLPMTRTTEDWNRPPVAMMLTYIWLDEGDNTILVTPPDGGGPNIDKFEIWATDVEMPRPEITDHAFGYDLTDEAVAITVDGTDAKGSALTDNTVSTIYPKGGQTGFVTYQLDHTYLITGYMFSEGNGADKQGTDWTLEYSADGRTFTAVRPSETEKLSNATLYRVTRQPHADKNQAARYFRVNTRGRDIAEIQLFGIPYTESADNRNFPADITEGLDIEQMVNGSPLGATEWADERCYNLFDRNMQTKYYTDRSLTGTVEIELARPMTLESYTLTSCQDYPDRDPRSWVVEGFDRSWETVSEVSDFEFPCRYATMRFAGNDRKLYRGFRLRVLENNGADRFQLLKWQLFGSETAGTERIAADNAAATIAAGRGEITVATTQRADYAVSRADGAVMAQGTVDATVTVQLPAGIYIVTCVSPAGKTTRKVTVK